MNNLSLAQVQELLRENKVLVTPEDDGNPVHTAHAMGIIGLEQVELTESGYFDGVDQSRMITHGRVVDTVGFGQRVMQAVLLDDGSLT